MEEEEEEKKGEREREREDDEWTLNVTDVVLFLLILISRIHVIPAKQQTRHRLYNRIKQCLVMTSLDLGFMCVG